MAKSSKSNQEKKKEAEKRHEKKKGAVSGPSQNLRVQVRNLQKKDVPQHDESAENPPKDAPKLKLSQPIAKKSTPSDSVADEIVYNLRSSGREPPNASGR